jgi:uncharacterized protein
MTADGDELAPETFAAAVETHSAVVYFAGDRAYKMKKPVDLGFLDFSSREARAEACAREVELNRRYAPDVYLGVADVRDPAGQSCEHLVVMRRMPASRRLAALVRSGAPVTGSLRQVARILAASHASATRSTLIADQGSRDALLRRWDDNLSQAMSVRGRALDAETVTEIGRLARKFLAGRAPLFAARIAAGRVMDGHGDLLADDIYCLDDGPRILDCLDFDDRLRWLDGLDDAAFLAMDTERLGAAGLARQFIDWYAEYSGDPAPASLRHHYVAYRAFVRAKVACIQCAQSIQAGAGDLAAAGQARQLAGLALRHLRAGAVTMVLVGGLPGTGKSALAGALADRLGWTVLNSDRIRKELAGVPAGHPAAAPFEAGIYAEAWTNRCYGELLRRAVALLADGESVMLDASWISAGHRAAAATAAARAGADLVQLCCTAPAGLAERRMAARPPCPSDANPQIARQMAAVLEPWPDATTIDTGRGGVGGSDESGAFGEIVREALGIVRPHGPDQVWRPARPVMLPG